MTDITFPKRRLNKKKGQSGQTYFQHFITEDLGCIYHPIPEENDFGIDGYIEFVEDELVTGRLLAVQIKHGDSFLRNTSSGGYKYYGENKHLNYYLNKNTPIIFIVYNDDFSKKHWVLFDIELTSPTDNGWWIEIPIDNIVDSNLYELWRNIAGPAINYKDEIKYNWLIDKVIKKSNLLLICIPKEDIEGKKFDYISSILKKITKNKEMMLQSRSTIDIFFPEYDNDCREIFDIPEIMEWLYNSIEFGIPWFYFLAHKEKNAGLKLLLESYAMIGKIIRKENGFLVEIDSDGFAKFFDKNFINLNRFTEQNRIPIEINKEVSEGIFDFFKRETVASD